MPLARDQPPAWSFKTSGHTNTRQTSGLGWNRVSKHLHGVSKHHDTRTEAAPGRDRALGTDAGGSSTCHAWSLKTSWHTNTRQTSGLGQRGLGWSRHLRGVAKHHDTTRARKTGHGLQGPSIGKHRSWRLRCVHLQEDLTMSEVSSNRSGNIRQAWFHWFSKLRQRSM